MTISQIIFWGIMFILGCFELYVLLIDDDNDF